MSSLKIKYLQRGEEEKWDAFIERNPGATLFHTTGWKSLIEKSFRMESLYFYAEEGDEVRGIFPIFFTKSFLGGKSLISVPFGVYGGICAAGKEEEERLLHEGMRLADERRARYLELRNIRKNDFRLPSLDLYVTFIRDLPERKESVLEMLPRKARAAARQGEDKFNLEAKVCRDHLQYFYHIFALNKRSLGSPIPSFRFFQNILEIFGEKAFLLNVLHQGKIISSVLTFLFKETIVPYYSGEIKKYHRMRINNFMYYKLMQLGVERGCKRFDFGRSRKETGSYFFKKNQGFTPQDLNYQYYLPARGEIPKLNPSNPKFDLPKKIWKSLPLPITKLIGPLLAKNFP